MPAGTALIAVPGQATKGPGWHWSSGAVEIDGDGTTFSGYAVDGTIDVTASNVTIDKVKVTQSGESFGIALRHTSNVTVSHSTITSPASSGPGRLMNAVKDIYADSTGTRILANDISHTACGVQMDAGLIQDNYIHDLAYNDGDHLNGTTSNAGTSQLDIIHNTIYNPHEQTDAISLFQDFGPQANRIISNNLLAGGGYTIYAGANPGKASTATNITVTNNRIARIYYPHGGYYGPATAYTPNGGNTWTNNIWDDTGQSISTP